MYTAGWKSYSYLCSLLKIPLLPITEQKQAFFIAHLSHSVQWDTIRSYLCAIRYFQIRAGLPDPHTSPMPRIPYILKGVQKHFPTHKRPKRQPITPEILSQIHKAWSQQPPSYDRAMVWAAFCLAFFGFMRSGELTSPSNTRYSTTDLSVNDISIDSHTNPQILTVHLRYSKTDQLGAGTFLHLRRTHQVLCPVASMLAYLVQRASIHAASGPLFIFQDSTPLTRHRLVTVLREAIKTIGHDPRGFSGHSFRIGAATTAARAGLRDSSIQRAGRWRSNAFMSYIQSQEHDSISHILSCLSPPP